MRRDGAAFPTAQEVLDESAVFEESSRAADEEELSQASIASDSEVGATVGSLMRQSSIGRMEHLFDGSMLLGVSVAKVSADIAMGVPAAEVLDFRYE